MWRWRTRATFKPLPTAERCCRLTSFSDTDKTFNIGDYYKPIVDAHSLDGKFMCSRATSRLPAFSTANKEMFNAAGIPMPDGTWTWDFKERPVLKEKDFLWVLHQLSKAGPDGKWIFGVTPNWEGNILFNFEFDYGNVWADDDQHPTKVLCSTPDWIKDGDFVRDLEQNKKWAPGKQEVETVIQSSAWQLFVSKRTAMLLDGIWDVPQVRKAMKPGEKGFFDWDVTLFPTYVGKPLHMTTGGSGYAIFSSTKHPQEAWRLTKFMAGLLVWPRWRKLESRSRPLGKSPCLTHGFPVRILRSSSSIPTIGSRPIKRFRRSYLAPPPNSGRMSILKLAASSITTTPSSIPPPRPLKRARLLGRPG